jgi:hypothetical protein
LTSTVITPDSKRSPTTTSSLERYNFIRRLSCYLYTHSEVGTWDVLRNQATNLPKRKSTLNGGFEEYSRTQHIGIPDFWGGTRNWGLQLEPLLLLSSSACSYVSPDVPVVSVSSEEQPFSLFNFLRYLLNLGK